MHLWAILLSVAVLLLIMLVTWRNSLAADPPPCSRFEKVRTLSMVGAHETLEAVKGGG